MKNLAFFTLIISIFLFKTVNDASCQTLKDSLQAYYPFIGNTLDISGHKRDGVKNNPALVKDRFNKILRAYEFNGSSDYISLPVSFDYPERTVSIWFKAKSITTFGSIYCSDHAALNYGLTKLGVHAAGGINYLNYSCGGQQLDVQIDTGIWYHAVIATGMDSVRFYLNSQLKATYHPTNIHSVDGVGYAVLGEDRGFHYPYQGDIDDVIIYNRVLSNNEINQLYQIELNDEFDCMRADYHFTGNLSDSSGNNYPATNNGAVLTSDRFKQINHAYYFDGSTSHISLPQSFDYAARTISLWFRADRIITAPGVIYCSDNSSLNYGLTALNVVSNSGINYLEFSGCGQAFDTQIDTGAWYHAVIVVVLDSVKYYLNNQYLASFPSANIHSIDGLAYSVLGEDRGFHYPFRGVIDDVKIFSCTLSKQQIQQLYTPYTGISNETVQLTDINIFPNPSKGIVHINLENPMLSNYTIRLTDMAGNCLINKLRYNVSGNTLIDIDLSQYPKGVYFLNVQSDNYNGFRKVILY